MIKSLYPKLAFLNIRKNGKLYIPYILSSVITIAMFYIMCSITFNKDAIEKLAGSNSIQLVMSLGTVVIGLFSFIFLFYTNSFLMKRRKKEIGLFNILGMEKRHISRIMFCEVLITSAISIVGGLGFGILFDKFTTMLLFKILRCNITFAFAVRPTAVLVTAIGFLSIFLLNLLYDITKVSLTNPIDLLHGSNVGEKEPRTKWLLAVLGVICLAVGYYIAITVKSPLQAISLFFVAVVLVIVGTYFLFIAGSIALLKLLRKNKKYYYNPKHFTSVSGMFYRMKQNAVGLANICILSTMVLVMVSTTVCMYVGTSDALLRRYPRDIRVTGYIMPENLGINDNIITAIEAKAKEEGYNLSNIHKSTTFSVTAGLTDGEYSSSSDGGIVASNMKIFSFRRLSDYEKESNNKLDLKDNECALYIADNNKEKLGETFKLDGNEYRVKYNLDSFSDTLGYDGYTATVYYLVLSDEGFINMYKSVNAALGDGEFQYISSEASFDIDATDAQQMAFAKEAGDISNNVISIAKNGYVKDEARYASSESRAGSRDSFYQMYGSFLFLGIYLGAMFLMITALIMYYKQISEGFDDKERFEIMQKVGMSKDEVKKTIHSQVITVFFLPLAMALIHIGVAFKMITRLMTVFNLTNVTLLLVCTLMTAAVFAVIYAIVYALTAKSYYKIVE
jgi:putative ABC transport system permease protein